MKAFVSVALILITVAPISSIAADTRPCVCQCIYENSSNIRQPDYFDASPFGSCGELDGKSCVGNDWAGTRYAGKLGECQDGPERIGSDLNLENVMQLTANSISPGVINNLIAAVR